MPEGAPDYEVSDGLPDEQEEEEDSIILECECGATLKILVGNQSDIASIAAASGWIAMLWKGKRISSICPRCRKNETC